MFAISNRAVAGRAGIHPARPTLMPVMIIRLLPMPRRLG